MREANGGRALLTEAAGLPLRLGLVDASRPTPLSLGLLISPLTVARGLLFLTLLIISPAGPSPPAPVSVSPPVCIMFHCHAGPGPLPCPGCAHHRSSDTYEWCESALAACVAMADLEICGVCDQLLRQ